jgi:hypothetical protein
MCIYGKRLRKGYIGNKNGNSKYAKGNNYRDG